MLARYRKALRGRKILGGVRLIMVVPVVRRADTGTTLERWERGMLSVVDKVEVSKVCRGILVWAIVLVRAVAVGLVLVTIGVRGSH